MYPLPKIYPLSAPLLQLGANHPMGHLKLADMIGLDTILSVCEAMTLEPEAQSLINPLP